MPDHTRDSITSAAHRLNPWWADAARFADFHRDLPPGRRSVYSELLRLTLETRPGPGILLAGFRRIGKTTVVKQLLKELVSSGRLSTNHVAYFDLQSFLLSGAPLEWLYAAFRRRGRPDAPRVIVLDEIQFLEEWEKQLRDLIETHAGPSTRVIATGSSTGLLARGAAGILLDRVDLVRMGTMCFHEWLDLAGTPQDAPEDEIDRAWASYLERGGFPRLLREESTTRAHEWIRETCELHVIDGDLARRHQVRNPTAFRDLFLHVAQNPGELFHRSNLAHHAGVHSDTVDQWVHLLEQGDLLFELRPSRHDGTPNRTKGAHPKLYPCDHGIPAAYGLAPSQGSVLETVVLRHLRQITRDTSAPAGCPAQLTYWRDSGQQGPNECDFRLSGEGLALLVEAKSAFQNNAASRLAGVCRKLRVDLAIIVHSGHSKERRTFGELVVNAWPAPEFALAVGRHGLAGLTEAWEGDVDAL